MAELIIRGAFPGIGGLLVILAILMITDRRAAARYSTGDYFKLASWAAAGVITALVIMGIVLIGLGLFLTID